MMPNTPTTGDCIAMLERLVAFDTTSRNSNLPLIHDVQNLLAEICIESRLTYNDEKTKANLWATIGPKDRGGIVLSGHTDVVPVDGQEWTSDPWTLTERDGKLFGRGSADMKGFVACCIAHAQHMRDADLKIPFHFAFSHDEEIGCAGVLPLVYDMRDNLPLPQAAIIGEPTSMQIIGGNKGGIGFTTTITGTDGHSSLPEQGANSIFAAAKMIVYLQEMQERLKRDADPQNGFDPYYTSVDCGIIRGGTAHNVIPAETVVNWGFRTTPFDDGAALAKEVHDYCANELEPAMKAISEECGFHHKPRHEVPGLKPVETSAAEHLVRHLSGLNHSGRVSYGAEAGHFQNAGVPSVIYGPGNIEQAHAPDEFIHVSQMDACNAFLFDLTVWATKNSDIL